MEEKINPTQAAQTSSVPQVAVDPVAPKNKSIFHNLWFRIIVGFFGVLMLIGGLFTIFSPHAKVSQSFLDKYNETASIEAEIVTALHVDLSAIDQKEKIKDYNGAVKILADALSQISDAAGKIDLHKQRVSELRSLSAQISDPDVKSKALTLIGLIEEEDIHSVKGFEYLKQLLGMLRSYYSDLAAGKNPPFSADTLINQLNTEQKIIADLFDKIISARDVFFKAAGLRVDSTPMPSISNSSNGQTGNHSLPTSQQPSQQPTSGNSQQQQPQTGSAIFGCPELQLVGAQAVKSNVPFVLQNTDSKPHTVAISLDAYSFSVGEKKTITIKGSGSYQPFCDGSKLGQLTVQ